MDCKMERERMAPVVTERSKRPRRRLPRILVVDDEPDLIELVGDVVGGDDRLQDPHRRDIDEAKKILANDQVELLVTDVNLPDGDGMSLLPSLRETQPQRQRDRHHRRAEHGRRDRRHARRRGRFPAQAVHRRSL